MPISRGQMPRQMYGLGSLVKSITKGVKSAVKGVVDVAKSPLGLAALGIGGAGLFGMGPLSQLASTKLGTTLAGLKSSPLVTGVSKFFGGEKTLGKTAAMFGLGGLGAAALEAAGLDPDNPNEMPRDIESLKGYLRSGYLKLNPGAKPEDVDAFVEANTREYSANGGRIGYQIGGDVAYDATDSIYGSSAITVTPDTVMGPGGNQIQDRMGKPGMVSPITGMPLPPGGIANMPATRPAPNRPPGGYIAMPDNLGIPMGPENSVFNKVPEEYRSGFAEYVKQNPIGAGGHAMTSVGLPDGGNVMFGDTASAAAFRNYLKSIGVETPNSAPELAKQQPLIDTKSILQDYGNSDFFSRISTMDVNPFTFGGKEMSGSSTYIGGLRNYLDSIGKSDLLQLPEPQTASLQKQKPLSPLAATAYYSNGGRIGYNTGSKGSDDLYTRSYKRVMELMDEGYDFGSAVKKYMEEEKEGRVKEAYGGRIMRAYGDVVDQASGIMGLPQRVNQAGVKELDLRDSGGFIPPVGVKEKADDIPAMLSNNEFVFTADAVRNMGDGNVNKGAQRMYDMMKYLEKGGRV